MNPSDDTTAPTPEELRDAEALRAYLDGTGPAPGASEAGVVGLFREAGGTTARTTPLSSAPMALLRRTHERRAWRWYGAAFSLAAAAVLAFFLWPRQPIAPPGATPEQHSRAIAALASPAPIGDRLAALHALANAARERLVFDMTHGATPPQTAAAHTAAAHTAAARNAAARTAAARTAPVVATMVRP